MVGCRPVRGPVDSPHGRLPRSARPNNKPNTPVSLRRTLSEGVLSIGVITGFD